MTAKMDSFNNLMGRIQSISQLPPEQIKLDVGVEAWSKERRDEDGNWVGGLIVATIPGGTKTDDEGEIVEVPDTFVCYDRFGRAGHQWHRLTESEIDRMTVVRVYQLGPVVRRLAAELGKNATRKPLSDWEIELGNYVGALTKAARAVQFPTFRKQPADEEF